VRSAVFTLVPPGDQWEDYRTYEALEAGSIPVIVRNASYKGCEQPGAHVLARVPGVLALDSWDELPALLATHAADPSSVRKRQRLILEWLAAEKRRVAAGLYEAVRRMRSGRWRTPTTCDYQHLNAYEIAAQHQHLAYYWRNPQWRKDHEWNATAFWAYFSGLCVGGAAGWCEEQDLPFDGAAGVTAAATAGSDTYPGLTAAVLVDGEYRGSAGRRFKGPDSFCESNLTDWAERCLTAGCALRHIYSFDCRPAHQPKPPDRPQW
jgi:hypothetical protein